MAANATLGKWTEEDADLEGNEPGPGGSAEGPRLDNFDRGCENQFVAGWDDNSFGDGWEAPGTTQRQPVPAPATTKTGQFAPARSASTPIHLRPDYRPMIQSPNMEQRPTDWGRLIRIKPFPENISSAQKGAVWLDYRHRLMVTFERATGMSERLKAGMVFTDIGTEISEIISAHGMFPNAAAVGQDFKFFQHLIGELDKYFDGLSDRSVCLNEYFSLKQLPKEGAREWYTRLMRQATVVHLETDSAMIRNRFLTGLRDRDFARRAFVDAFPLGDTVDRAARAEIASATVDTPFTPWNDGQQTAREVYAVESPAGERQGNGGGPVKTKSWQKNRPVPYGKRERPKPKCGACGYVHRGDACPAATRACNKCGDIGHFETVCTKAKPKKVAAVTDSEPAFGEDLKYEVKPFE